MGVRPSQGVGTSGSSLCTPLSLTWLDQVVPSQKRIWWWPAGSGYQLGGCGAPTAGWAAAAAGAGDVQVIHPKDEP